MSAPSANQLLEAFYDAMHADRDEECERHGRALLALINAGVEPSWHVCAFDRDGFRMDARRLGLGEVCR